LRLLLVKMETREGSLDNQGSFVTAGAPAANLHYYSEVSRNARVILSWRIDNRSWARVVRAVQCRSAKVTWIPPTTSDTRLYSTDTSMFTSDQTTTPARPTRNRREKIQ
jgi:hypothetical protein